MRLKSFEDVEKLGLHARKQIAKALGRQKIPSQRRFLSSDVERKAAQLENSDHTLPKKKKASPSRVMKTADGHTYCPWPSKDPFVKVHQRLAARYGLYENGGQLVTEMIVDGGEKNWRFDFAIIPHLAEFTRNEDVHNSAGDPNNINYTGSCALLLEADGFAFHKSLDAFKNDRAKQTHALKQGFVLKRITNEDVRERLNQVMGDIEAILAHRRIYPQTYHIRAKGKTQSVFRWRTR